MSPLKSAWQRWKRLAERAAQVQSQALLFVLYFVLVAPCALVIRAFIRSSPTGWIPIPMTPSDLDSAKNQF